MEDKFEKLVEMYKELLSSDRLSGDHALAYGILEASMSGSALDCEDFTQDFWNKYADALNLPREAHMSGFAQAGPNKNLQHLCEDYNLSTEDWFKKTDPEPTQKRLNAQFGCHLEEVKEMLDEVSSDHTDVNAKIQMAGTLLKEVGEYFKSGRANLVILNDDKLYDSLLDQRVTGIGTMHLAGYKVSEGVARVDWANFTKFVDGVPQYKEGGKVAKGPYFWEPVLPKVLPSAPDLKEGND